MRCISIFQLTISFAFAIRKSNKVENSNIIKAHSMLPKHHKTGFFLKEGLFDNLTCFAELEQRISGLPSMVEAGDAFEVFAEAL